MNTDFEISTSAFFAIVRMAVDCLRKDAKGHRLALVKRDHNIQDVIPAPRQFRKLNGDRHERPEHELNWENVPSADDRPDFDRWQNYLCPECHGIGTDWAGECEFCDGTGYLW